MIRNGEETKEFFNKNKKEFENYKLIELVQNFNETIIALKTDAHNCGFDWKDFEEQCKEGDYKILGSDDENEIVYVSANTTFQHVKQDWLKGFIENEIERIIEVEC